MSCCRAIASSIHSMERVNCRAYRISINPSAHELPVGVSPLAFSFALLTSSARGRGGGGGGDSKKMLLHGSSILRTSAAVMAVMAMAMAMASGAGAESRQEQLIFKDGGGSRSPAGDSTLQLHLHANVNDKPSLVDILTVQPGLSIFYDYLRESSTLSARLANPLLSSSVFAPSDTVIAALNRKPHAGPATLSVMMSVDDEKARASYLEQWVMAHIVDGMDLKLHGGVRVDTLANNDKVIEFIAVECGDGDCNQEEWRRVAVKGSASSGVEILHKKEVSIWHGMAWHGAAHVWLWLWLSGIDCSGKADSVRALAGQRWRPLHHRRGARLTRHDTSQHVHISVALLFISLELCNIQPNSIDRSIDGSMDGCSSGV